LELFHGSERIAQGLLNQFHLKDGADLHTVFLLGAEIKDLPLLMTLIFSRKCCQVQLGLGIFLNELFVKHTGGFQRN
jgi:hypothetical protein